MNIILAHTQEVFYFYSFIFVIIYLFCLYLKIKFYKTELKYASSAGSFILADLLGLVLYIILSDYFENNPVLNKLDSLLILFPFFTFILCHFVLVYLTSIDRGKLNIILKSLYLGSITPLAFKFSSLIINNLNSNSNLSY